jgi:hypothetical protein
VCFLDQAKYKTLQITNLQVLKAKWPDLLVIGSSYTWKLQHASSGNRQRLLVIPASAHCAIRKDARDAKSDTRVALSIISEFQQ